MSLSCCSSILKSFNDKLDLTDPINPQDVGNREVEELEGEEEEEDGPEDFTSRPTTCSSCLACRRPSAPSWSERFLYIKRVFKLPHTIFPDVSDIIGIFLILSTAEVT